MEIILDPKAGTCGGVRRAIHLAERELAEHAEEKVFVLGDIIHNEREVDRLDKAGLKTLHKEELDELIKLHQHPRKTKVLVRAHGEPPETFKKLQELGVNVVDGTCPVVTRSQDLARQYQQDGYQVAIVGKHNHPEMIGIVGHTESMAVIVQFDDDINKLQPNVPTLVMAQTTISPAWFNGMVDKIREHIGEVELVDTLCRFVVRREENLPHFATQADVILVVGGHKSSNTKMLHATCSTYNPCCHHVVSTDEIDIAWFEGVQRIGVTGSASTPLWLLHEFVDALIAWDREGKLDGTPIAAEA